MKLKLFFFIAFFIFTNAAHDVSDVEHGVVLWEILLPHATTKKIIVIDNGINSPQPRL